MKLFSIFLLSLIMQVSPEPEWFTDFEIAKKEAVKSDKLILISFSGLDWCSHCNKMKREVWDSKEFREMATQKLVLVRADFPRSEENRQDEAQIKRNKELSKLYNPAGVLPMTVLIDTKGNVVRKWEGYPRQSPDRFTADISTTVDANMQ